MLRRTFIAVWAALPFMSSHALDCHVTLPMWYCVNHNNSRFFVCLAETNKDGYVRYGDYPIAALEDHGQLADALLECAAEAPPEHAAILISEANRNIRKGPHSDE